jgi:hypothetical protein
VALGTAFAEALSAFAACFGLLVIVRIVV